MHGYGARNLPPINPFLREVPRTPEVQYAQTVSALARGFIYDDADIASIEKKISAARTIPAMAAIEDEKHELESLLCLLKGIEAHERANLYHGGAWQAALIRQPAHGERAPKPPETLSREEVAEEFAAFPFRQKLVDSESEALKQYGKLLELNTEAVVKLSQNISLQHTDIEVLINDIAIRMAERILDTEERNARLSELDRELTKIIERIPDDDRGKRFELEEIYLLRRLIHAADTGHLASVSHGTPREDLRPDRGSVDIEITAAGDAFGFQLKTLKYGVSKPTREKQGEIVERARGKLEGAATHLVVLEAEAVQDTFEASLRQAKTVPTSRADKFAALQPVTDVLRMDESHRLLTVLGLTEADLKREQAEFDKKYEERKKLEEALEQKRREEAQRDAEAEERRKQEDMEEREREAEEQARRDAIAQHREEAKLSSEIERKTVMEAKEQRILQRQRERQEERDALTRQAAEREKEEAKQEAARLKRQQKEQEAPAWPPKTIANLSSSSALKRFGFLPEDWKDDVGAFMAAKKRFIGLFGKPKNKNVQATETDKPNALFQEAFPTKESIESSTAEDIERVRTITKK